jgi:hypothetical protein
MLQILDPDMLQILDPHMLLILIQLSIHIIPVRIHCANSLLNTRLNMFLGLSDAILALPISTIFLTPSLTLDVLSETGYQNIVRLPALPHGFIVTFCIFQPINQ